MASYEMVAKEFSESVGDFRRTRGQSPPVLEAAPQAVPRRLEASRVQLPAGAGDSYEVYVNGVRQEPGRDFDRIGDELVFRRALAQEGRLGPVRWLSMLLGVAGTYRKHETVDLVYEEGGRRTVRASPS